MAFIEYKDDHAIPERYRVPDSDNILRIHGIHPAIMRGHYDLYIGLMHREGPLTRRQREILAVRVSALNRCHY